MNNLNVNAIVIENDGDTQKSVNPTHYDLQEAFAIIGADSLWKSINKTFGLMEIADQEINRFSNHYPAKQKDINSAFKYLCWSRFDVVNEPLYRHHVRELLTRVVYGEKLNTGTKAEVLVTFHKSSLIAPLNQNGAHLMHKLFIEIMGKHCIDVPDWQFLEEWPGAYDEMLCSAQRRLSCERDVSE